MQFTWIDCATGDKDVNSFGANGQNDWEKGLGSALTYAERYFLLKYFHIATDEDDIDNDQRKTTAPINVKPADKLPELTADKFEAMVKAINEGKKLTVEVAMKNYTIKPEYLNALNLSLKNN